MGHSVQWEAASRNVSVRALMREIRLIEDGLLKYCCLCGWPEQAHDDPAFHDSDAKGYSCSLDDCPGFEEAE